MSTPSSVHSRKIAMGLSMGPEKRKSLNGLRPQPSKVVPQPPIISHESHSPIVIELLSDDEEYQSSKIKIPQEKLRVPAAKKSSVSDEGTANQGRTRVRPDIPQTPSLQDEVNQEEDECKSAGRRHSVLDCMRKLTERVIYSQRGMDHLEYFFKLRPVSPFLIEPREERISNDKQFTHAPKSSQPQVLQPNDSDAEPLIIDLTDMDGEPLSSPTAASNFPVHIKTASPSPIREGSSDNLQSPFRNSSLIYHLHQPIDDYDDMDDVEWNEPPADDDDVYYMSTTGVYEEPYPFPPDLHDPRLPNDIRGPVATPVRDEDDRERSKRFPSNQDNVRSLNSKVINVPPSRKTIKQRFKCWSCDVSFGKKKDRDRHVKTTHNSISQKCEICSEVFAQERSLIRHQVVCALRRYVCTVCKLKFNRKEALKTHMKSHDGSRKKRKSPKSVSRDRLLQSRKETRSQDKRETTVMEKKRPGRRKYRYKCRHCPQVFSGTFLRTCHEKTHTKELDTSPLKSPVGNMKICAKIKIAPYKCNYCAKRFFQLSQRSIHERVHTGEKPFSCIYCNKKFAQTCFRNYHENEHTGRRPYHCQVCGLQFTSPQARCHHMKKAHKGYKLDKSKQVIPTTALISTSTGSKISSEGTSPRNSEKHQDERTGSFEESRDNSGGVRKSQMSDLRHLTAGCGVVAWNVDHCYQTSKVVNEEEVAKSGFFHSGKIIANPSVPSGETEDEMTSTQAVSMQPEAIDVYQCHDGDVTKDSHDDAIDGLLTRRGCEAVEEVNHIETDAGPVNDGERNDAGTVKDVDSSMDEFEASDDESKFYFKCSLCDCEFYQSEVASAHTKWHREQFKNILK